MRAAQCGRHRWKELAPLALSVNGARADLVTSAERLAFQAGTASLATSKLYMRAVLAPTIWPVRRAARPPGSPPGSAAIEERSTRCADSPSPTSCCPQSCFGADDVAQANTDGVLLEAQQGTTMSLPRCSQQRGRQARGARIRKSPGFAPWSGFKN